MAESFIHKNLADERKEIQVLRLSGNTFGMICLLPQLVPYFDTENLGRMIGRSATR